MNRRFRPIVLFFLVALIIGGCAHAISRQNRVGALEGLSPETILQDLQVYKGRLVLMGGEIIETRNLEQETVIEILEKPLSSTTGRPLTDREGDGRFLVRYRGFKDPYVFSQGREITVAGVVQGEEVSKVGQREYTYLVLENKETHLWREPEAYEGYFGYPPYPYWYPYYPWDPWCAPPYRRYCY